MGSIVTQTFAFDGGRGVTTYVPPRAPESVVYAADGGWHVERLAVALEESTDAPATMVIGVHGLDDDDRRLEEYVESFGGERFRLFEEFFVHEVRAWAVREFGIQLPRDRCAVWGASLGGELALAVGLRHRDKFGAILCVSPGGGFTPIGRDLFSDGPDVYLLGGTQEPWFFNNASAWADAFTEAGVNVVLKKRDGEHGGSFWYDEFPQMVSWAFTR